MTVWIAVVPFFEARPLLEGLAMRWRHDGWHDNADEQLNAHGVDEANDVRMIQTPMEASVFALSFRRMQCPVFVCTLEAMDFLEVFIRTIQSEPERGTTTVTISIVHVRWKA